MKIHLIENFGTDFLSNTINSLSFVPKELGEEIDCFNFVDPNYSEVFSRILNVPVELPAEWGGFRRSYPMIHFDDHKQTTLFSAIIALDDVTYTSYRHKELKFHSVYEMPNDLDLPKFICDNASTKKNWKVVNQIQIPKYSLFFYEPWYWHSFTKGTIQRFTVERKIEVEEVKNED